MAAMVCGTSAAGQTMEYAETLTYNYGDCMRSHQSGVCKCPNGFFLSDVKKRQCNDLSCLSNFRCSRIEGVTVSHRKDMCPERPVDWTNSSWAKCEDDEVLVGFRRRESSDDAIQSLTKIRCCKTEFEGFAATAEQAFHGIGSCMGDDKSSWCKMPANSAMTGLFRGRSGECTTLDCIETASVKTFSAAGVLEVLPYAHQYVDIRQTCMSSNKSEVCKCKDGYAMSSVRIGDCRGLECMYSWMCSKVANVEVDHTKSTWIKPNLKSGVLASCPAGQVVVGWRRQASEKDELSSLVSLRCCSVKMDSETHMGGDKDIRVLCKKGVMCGPTQNALISGFRAHRGCKSPFCIRNMRTVKFYGKAPLPPRPSPKFDTEALPFTSSKELGYAECFSKDNARYCGCTGDSAISALGKSDSCNDLSCMSRWTCSSLSTVSIEMANDNCNDVPVDFRVGGWVSCPVNKVVKGFRRDNSRDNLTDLMMMRCCKVRSYNGVVLGNQEDVDYTKCLRKNKSGACESREGGLLTGIYLDRNIFECRGVQCLLTARVQYGFKPVQP